MGMCFLYFYLVDESQINDGDVKLRIKDFHELLHGLFVPFTGVHESIIAVIFSHALVRRRGDFVIYWALMDGYRIRFVPLGGIVGVTKNMYLYELYKGEELTDILVVDCGIGFTREKDLGVDYVIPDISYLKDKKDKIRAILLTHGHDDHISALRFHYKDLGSPPVYADKLTALFTESKCAEFNIQLKVNIVSYRTNYEFGPLTARFIHLTHSIPDTTHILITTPVGAFYHGSDYMTLQRALENRKDF